MGRDIAAYFDVRGGTLYGSPLSVGGIMHIVLPADHPEFDTLTDALSRGKPLWVPPSEPTYSLLDFVSRVINATGERFNAKSRERAAEEVGFRDAQNVLRLSQGFTDFGRLVSPRPVAYPPAIRFERDGMIARAADELERFLLSKYGPRLSQAEIQEIRFRLLEVCAEFVEQQWAEKIAALSRESRSVHGPTYRDYLTCFSEDSDQIAETTRDVLLNCGSALASFSEFITDQFIDVSGLPRSLPYATVEQIKKALEGSAIEGARLYACVAYLHDRPIPHRPNLDAGEVYTSFANDGEIIDTLLSQYDVSPIVEARTLVWFSAVLEGLPVLLEYPYREVNLVRTFVATAIRNAYLLCLVWCE
jgi:hypothetical protein